MDALAKIGRRWDLHRIQQVIKWIVYSLIVVNFGFYVVEDFTRATHALHDESGLFDLIGAFATSSLVLAWLMLLAMFELETYAIEDDAWSGWVSKAVHGVRLFCFLMIAQAIFALAEWTWQLREDVVLESSDGPCALVGQDFSWTYNLDYWEITEDNCAGLSADPVVYRLGGDAVVTDAKGQRLERQLAWGDLTEIIAWLIIILCMEVLVRLQGKGITDSPLMRRLRFVKVVLYGFLAFLALWWQSLGHTLYLWDTFLWIAGFSVIEMNLNEWRDEILEQQDDDRAAREGGGA